MDPYWEKKVINPSRCALMTSDQWGTVSQAYKQDLLVASPLCALLGKHPKVKRVENKEINIIFLAFRISKWYSKSSSFE